MKQFPVVGDSTYSPRSYEAHGRDPGVDIFARTGSSIVAVDDGVIVPPIGYSRVGGNRVWLKTAGGYFYYAHLRIIQTRAGRKVKAGDVIGAVGASGNASGKPAHLHFGQTRTGPGGAWIDPTALLNAARGPVANAGPAAKAITNRADLVAAGPDWLENSIIGPIRRGAEFWTLIAVGIVLVSIAAAKLSGVDRQEVTT